MAEKPRSKQDWLKYAGNMAQVAGLTEMEYTAGKARGMRVWQVKTADGLVLDLLPDKCMNIGALSYRGTNISWLAKNGQTSGKYAYPVLNEFDRYFDGGMLWTCGLKNTGPDYIDENGLFQHLHGRLGTTPCEQAWHKEYWQGDDYLIEIGGVTRDSHLAFHNLTLTRTIKINLLCSAIEITDVIETCEPEAAEYLSLYHFNFGYPFISPDLKMVFPDALSPILPRTRAAEDGIGTWNQLEPPVDGYEEQCFFHHLKTNEEGWAAVRLENKPLGIAAELSWEKELLPILTEWKSVRSGEYVLGIEPGNSYLRGFAEEKEQYKVGVIDGFSTKTMRLKLQLSDI